MYQLNTNKITIYNQLDFEITIMGFYSPDPSRIVNSFDAENQLPLKLFPNANCEFVINSVFDDVGFHSSFFAFKIQLPHQLFKKS